jgi:predicted Zn-dependent peptidase
MIRRNPTLIAMGDADVQDVRSLLAKKQAEASKSSNSSANVKGKQGPPPQPPAAAVHVTDEAKRRRDAREERLGITH